MKLSTLVLLAATLIATSNNAKACLEGDGHAHANGMGIPTSSELGFENDIDMMMTKTAIKSLKTTKKGLLSARLDMNFDGIDDGPQREPFLGLPMRYPSFPNDFIGGTMGQAILHRGMPAVLYSTQDAQMHGPIIMGFFMQHEFAHHDLGHSRPSNEPQAVKEANADCNAARSLVSQGRRDVLPVIIQWFEQRGCGYDPRTPVQMVRDSHPCGTQRAQILRQCAGM